MLSPKQRIFFVIIIGSFLLGTFFLMLAALLIGHSIIRRAWVPEPKITRHTIIGRPSTPVSELQALDQLREDVPLPETGLMFDANFRPIPDGFSFANYGSRFPEGNLTIVEAQELFGSAVCASGSGDSCLPNPAAQMWIDTMNDYMADGHCAGFTVASRRFFENQLNQANFMPAANLTYDINQNVPMMRQIAKDWAMQVTEEVWQARAAGTPRDVVDALLERQEPVDLGVFGRAGGGHSLLAYGIEDQGDGIYHILVYDNNWPGQELYVAVDYKANTWRYALGATDPTSTAAVWEGDAASQTLMFIPFEVYDRPVTCPFCEDGNAADGAKFTFVSLTGNEAQLQVTAEGGHKIGHIGDEFVNEVDGARLTRLKDRMYNDREPYLALPVSLPFTTTVVPRPGKVIANAHLRMGGPGFAFAVDGLTLAQTQGANIAVTPDDRRVVYRANGPTAPTVKLAVQQPGRATLANVGDVTLLDAENLNVTLTPQSGELIVSGRAVAPPSTVAGNRAEPAAGYDSGGSTPPTAPAETALPAERPKPPGQIAGPLAERLGATISDDEEAQAGGTEPGAPAPPENAALIGQAETSLSVVIAVINRDQQPWLFMAPAIPYLPQGSVAFDVVAWDGVSPMVVRLDRDGDGIYEEAHFVENQPLATLLARQLSALDIIISLGELDPYLGDPEIAAFLAELTRLSQQHSTAETLTSLGLDGDDVGEILFAMSGFQLSNEDLAEFITGLNLPPDEAAHLLFELNRLPDELNALLEALGLPPDVIGLVREQLAELQEADEVLVEWELTNQPLEDLPAFLNLFPNLTDEQIGFILDELNLELAEVAEVMAGLEPSVATLSLTTIFYELNLTQGEIDFVIEELEKSTGVDTGWEWPGPQIPPAPQPTSEPAATPQPQPSPTSQPTPVATPIPQPTLTPTPIPPPPAGNNDDDDDDDGGGGGDGSSSPANNPPLAVGDASTTDMNVSLVIDVLANDSDPDGNSLSVVGVGGVGNGGVSINGGGSSVIYTPNPNFFGNDSFTYTISDGGLTGSAKVNMFVNAPPAAAADTVTIPENVPTSINVLANDSDPNGTTPTLLAVGPGANGTPSLSGGAILYTPNTNFWGTDVFTYTITDNRLAGSATVSVMVNGAPLAVDDLATTAEETPLIVSVLLNDTDPENDTLTLLSVNPAGNGAVSKIGNTVQYLPNPDFSGVDTFIYNITDGVTPAVSGQVVVTVTNLNDPPLANGDNASTNEDTPQTIDVTANDSDPDNDPLTVTFVGLAGNGGTAIVGNNVVYTPTLNYFGTDTFTYTISDGSLSASASVSMIINPVNDDPPAAVPDTATTSTAMPINIPVLDNDSDPDNDTINIIDVGPAANGVTTFLGSNSPIQYTSNPAFTGTDTFTYTISDGGLTATTVVTVTVTP